MAIEQPIGPVFRGEAIAFRFTLTPTTDITGWTVSFRVKQQLSDATALQTLAGSLTTPASGLLTVSLSATVTTSLPDGMYAYDLWRTDSGSEACLSTGAMQVKGSVRLP